MVFERSHFGDDFFDVLDDLGGARPPVLWPPATTRPPVFPGPPAGARAPAGSPARQCASAPRLEPATFRVGRISYLCVRVLVCVCVRVCVCVCVCVDALR